MTNRNEMPYTEGIRKKLLDAVTQFDFNTDGTIPENEFLIGAKEMKKQIIKKINETEL